MPLRLSNSRFFFSKSEKNSVNRGVRVLRARASHARRACEARAVKPKVWNEAEDRERDWGETLKIRTVRFAYVIFVQITRFSQSRAIPIGLIFDASCIFSVSPQSRSLSSASFKTFCLTPRAYLNTQKYGLFCSQKMPLYLSQLRK